MSETIEFEATAMGTHVLFGRAIPAPDSVKTGVLYRFTATQVESELKPCPRCGGEMYMAPGEFGTSCYAACDQCNARGPLCDTYKEAVEAHNARKSPELDPCPHCGGEAQAKHTEDGFGQDHVWVRCLHCPAQTMPLGTEAKAVAAWNRRPQ